METNKNNGKSSGSAFLWGLVIGGLLATLVTTKKGRAALREVVNLSLELFEDFVEERGRKNIPEEDITSASEDLESEIIEDEAPPVSDSVSEPAPETVPPVKNGHSKKRLFRGIRRK